MTSPLFDLEMSPVLGAPSATPDLPHWLLVEEWDPDDPDADDLFEIEHHPDCPTEQVGPTRHYVMDGIEADPDFTYETHSCIFQQMVDDAGIDSYFQHREDTRLDVGHPERVDPGRWLIEPWFETYHGPEGDEYDAGLRLSTRLSGPSHD